MIRPDEEPILLFSKFSEFLLGDHALDAELSRRYFDRLQNDTFMQTVLEELLRTFASLPEGEEHEMLFRSRIMNEPRLGKAARRILVLWYTGGLLQDDRSAPGQEKLDYPSADATQYFGALMWPVMRAHAPAISGGYFGYWRYPPEN